MSKYNPLSARLAGHAGPEWRASFSEIEEVLGFALPKGARAGSTWWRNTGAQPHQRAWMQAGWEAAEVDHASGLVIFRRVSAHAPPAERPFRPPAAPADEPQILKRLEPNRTWGVALMAASAAVMVGVGALAIRGLRRRR
jgi:hypothetical protein